MVHEAVLLVSGWPPQEADHGRRHQRVVLDVPVIQAIADSYQLDVVIDLSGTWDELTKIVFVRCSPEPWSPTPPQSSPACSAIGASCRLPGRSASSTMRSRTIASWSTLESSHVAV
jgi:hypothetical protein